MPKRHKREVIGGIVVAIVVTTWVGVCLIFDDADISIEIAGNEFEKIPGSIGVKFEKQDKEWLFTVARGEVSIPDALPESVPGSYEPVRGSPRVDDLPEPGQGLEYNGPFQISPDGHYLATSVRRVPAGPSTNIVFVNLQTRIETARVEIPENGRVVGMAWAPDSSMLSILRFEYGHLFCPIDLLSWLVFHPISRTTYYLEIVDLNGNTVAASKLVSNLRSIGFRRIVWF